MFPPEGVSTAPCIVHEVDMTTPTTSLATSSDALSDEQIKRAISEAIGFDWKQGELQAVNAHDLFNIARAIAALPSPANTGEGEIQRLRGLAATCYAGLGAECNLPEPWLDALNAAANGDPFSTDGLLPFVADRAAPTAAPEQAEECTTCGALVVGVAAPGAAIAAREQEDAATLLRKYKKLCVEIGRGDSYHLNRIDNAISSLASRNEASAASAHADLMRFYSVDTLDALIAAQAHHIEKLQSKLQPAPSLAPQRVREG